MFSLVPVYPQGEGSPVTITHDTPRRSPGPLDIRHETPGSTVRSGGHHLRPVQTSSRKDISPWY